MADSEGRMADGGTSGVGAVNARLVLALAMLLNYDLTGELRTDLEALAGLVEHMLVLKFDEECPVAPC